MYKKFILRIFSPETYSYPSKCEGLLDYIFDNYFLEDIVEKAHNSIEVYEVNNIFILAKFLLEDGIYNISEKYLCIDEDYNYGDYIYVQIDKNTFEIYYEIDDVGNLEDDFIKEVDDYIARENLKLERYLKKYGD